MCPARARLFSCLTFTVCTLLLANSANAQSAVQAAAAIDDGYVEGVAQSAFGNVTSQSYGVEAGYTIFPDVQIYGEFGRVRDAASDAIGANAAIIAGALAQSQSNVSFSAAEPITFFSAGAKYIVFPGEKLKPYVLGGLGFGIVKHDVTFAAGGSDITDDLDQYGVALGEDLSGSSTGFMVTLGAGAQYPVGRHFLIDLQFRFNHVAADEGFSVGRAGVGFGVRF